MTSAIEGDRRARATHSADEILPLAIDEANDRIFIRSVTDRAAPFVCQLVAVRAKVSLHFATKKLGKKPRRLIATGLPIGNPRGIGANHDAVVVLATKEPRTTDANPGLHDGRS